MLMTLLFSIFVCEWKPYKQDDLTTNFVPNCSDQPFLRYQSVTMI